MNDNGGLEIKKLEPEDMEKLFSFINKAKDENYVIDSVFKGIAEMYEQTSLMYKKIMSNPITMMGIYNGEIQTILVIFPSAISIESHNARMFMLSVRKFRNKDTASALLGAAIDEAKKSSGIKNIHAYVDMNSTEVMEVLEKFEFEIVGLYKNYFKIDGKFSNCIILSKSI